MYMKRITPALLLALVLLAGCRQADPTPAATGDVAIEMAVRPQPPAVGPATLVISVTDAEGNGVTDAEVTAVGDMSHAGMAPVTGTTDIGSDGDYTIPFAWTMAGDWFVDVTVTLEDGRALEQRFDVSVGAAMDGEATAAADG